MKVYITYASVGAGHHRTAQALYDYLKENRSISELKLVDALKHSNIVFKFFCSWGYSFLVSKTPTLWGLFFWLTNFRLLRVITRAIARVCNWTNTMKFSNFLIRENPDFIISTHFLPTEIVSNLKRRKKIKAKLLTIITDYILHPYWISPQVDFYIVATDETKKQLIREKVKEESIKVLGLPVNPKFLISFDRTKILRQLGIENDAFTVMVVMGSFGIGPIEKIVEILKGKVRLVVICAGNRRLYTRLKNKNLADVFVFGFVDNIQEFMAISDMIITKPGGSTITEVLIMGIVPVFISPIPGQEAGNIEVLEKYGVGISGKSVAEIKDIVLDFKQHPEKLQGIKNNINKIRNPDVLKQIADVICTGTNRTSG